MSTNSDNSEDELQLYKDVNEEMRRFYDYIVRSFEHIKNKALALLVGEVAIVTFLFQDFEFKIDNETPIYGPVVLSLGIALLVFAYIMFLTVISKIQWQFPTEEHDMKNPTERFKSSPLEYQKYQHSEYMKKAVYCSSKASYRAVKFMHGIYALSVGVFLVILVKYGGGA